MITGLQFVSIDVTDQDRAKDFYTGVLGFELLSDDIEATYAELSAKGVEFTVQPKIESWGSWWAQFRDSEGNEFGLGQRTEDRP